jgi:hypothetical protein
MDKIELARTGRQLAAQLDDIAAGLPSKSEEFNVLLWEADILRAKAEDLERNCGVIPHLESSVLLRNGCKSLLSRMSKIIDEVRAFHSCYDEQAGM